MEHIDTTHTPGQKVVFLGMAAENTEHGMVLSVQPKGEGWKWIPQRFIDYSSCHTHHTKHNLFKGMVIRAYTICNTQITFEAAVRDAAEGLIARGFAKVSLLYSWKSFMQTRFKGEGKVSRGIDERFREWLQQEDFSQAPPRTLTKTTQEVMHAKRTRHLLLCGLYAINEILEFRNLDKITKAQIDDINCEIAIEEMRCAHQESIKSIYNRTQSRGNYPVEVLLGVLEVYADVDYIRWTLTTPVTSNMILIGSGDHWTALIQNQEGFWDEHNNGQTYPVANLQHLLKTRTSNGAAYILTPHTQPAGGDMEGTEENTISQDLLSQSMASTQSEISTQALLLAVSTSMPDSQPDKQPENPPARQPAPSGRHPPKSRESRESIEDAKDQRQERWLTNQQSVRKDALTAKRTTPMQNNLGELATDTEE